MLTSNCKLTKYLSNFIIFTEQTDFSIVAKYWSCYITKIRVKHIKTNLQNIVQDRYIFNFRIHNIDRFLIYLLQNQSRIDTFPDLT